jgi:thioredoxin 1
MKNSTIILMGAILLIGGAGVYALSQSNASKMGLPTETMMAKGESESTPETADDVMMKEEGVRINEDTMVNEDEVMVKETTMMKSASYVPFSTTALVDAAATKRVLFFYANWCPTCKPIDAELSKQSAEIPDGMTVIRVNYNDADTDQTEKDLAKKYGVTYQHTFVQLDAAGEAIATWNGGGLAELTKNSK